MPAKITKFTADGTFIRFEAEAATLYKATLHTASDDYNIGEGAETHIDLQVGIDRGIIVPKTPFVLNVIPRDAAGEFGPSASVTFELKDGAIVLVADPTPDENPGAGGEGMDQLPPHEDEDPHVELPPAPEPEHRPADIPPPRKEEAPKPPSPAPKPGTRPNGRIETLLTEAVTGIKAIAEQGAVNTAALKAQSAAIGTLCSHAEGTRKELGKFDLHLAGHNNSMGKLTEILGNQNTQMGALTLVMDQFRKDANERAARKNETPERTDEPAPAKDNNQKKGNGLNWKKILAYIPAVVLVALAAWYFLGDHSKKASGNGAPPPANAAAIAAEQAAATNNDASGIVVSNGVPIVKGLPSHGQPSITIKDSTNVHDISIDNHIEVYPTQTEVIYAPAPERTPTYTAPASSTYNWHAPGTDTQPSAQASAPAQARETTVYVPVPAPAARRSIFGINVGVSGGGCYGGPGWYPGCYGYGGYRKGGQTTVINIRKDTYNVQQSRQYGPAPHGGSGPGGHGGSPHWSK